MLAAGNNVIRYNTCIIKLNTEQANADIALLFHLLSFLHLYLGLSTWKEKVDLNMDFPLIELTLRSDTKQETSAFLPLVKTLAWHMHHIYVTRLTPTHLMTSNRFKL